MAPRSSRSPSTSSDSTACASHRDCTRTVHSGRRSSDWSTFGASSSHLEIVFVVNVGYSWKKYPVRQPVGRPDPRVVHHVAPPHHNFYRLPRSALNVRRGNTTTPSTGRWPRNWWYGHAPRTAAPNGHRRALEHHQDHDAWRVEKPSSFWPRCLSSVSWLSSIGTGVTKTRRRDDVRRHVALPRTR